MFTSLCQAPADPVLGIGEAFRNDAHPKAVDLGVGAYRTENGKPYIFDIVRKVEHELLDDPNAHHEYLPMRGNSKFYEEARELLLPKATTKSVQEGRVASCQTLSGTGAVRMCGDLLKLSSATAKSRPRVFISSPSWANHAQIFGEALGFEVVIYPYWKEDTLSIDVPAMCKFLRDTAKPGDMVILQTCAHNPTGQDPNQAEWGCIRKAVIDCGVLPLFDTAYQGFASGDMDADAWSIRFFEEAGIELMIAQSFAKNMGLYGERVGAIHVVCSTAERAVVVGSRLGRFARVTYSNPSKYGAAIAERILARPEYKEAWLTELSGLSKRIRDTRQAFRTALEAAKAPGTWEHITSQIGMFCYTGLPACCCERLSSEYHIYLLKNGRISIAGLNPSNLQYVAESVAAILNENEMA